MCTQLGASRFDQLGEKRAGSQAAVTAHVRGMTMTLYASGPLLGEETVIGDPTEIVDALIAVQLSHIGAIDRNIARRALATAVADEIQASLIEAAVQAGEWRFDDVSALTVERLTRSRAYSDNDGKWEHQLTLIVVRPDGHWVNPPTGSVFSIDPTTDLSLVLALVQTTWLDVERLD